MGNIYDAIQALPPGTREALEATLKLSVEKFWYATEPLGLSEDFKNLLFTLARRQVRLPWLFRRTLQRKIVGILDIQVIDMLDIASKTENLYLDIFKLVTEVAYATSVKDTPLVDNLVNKIMSGAPIRPGDMVR